MTRQESLDTNGKKKAGVVPGRFDKDKRLTLHTGRSQGSGHGGRLGLENKAQQVPALSAHAQWPQ